MCTPRKLLFVVTALCCVAAWVPPAGADVLHLRTGEAVKGRPVQERSNENYLAVEDYLTGAMRRFVWSSVDAADRDRLQELWGWKSTGQNVIEGHRVILRFPDGREVEELGLIEKEDAGAIWLRRGGDVLEIKKAWVRTTEKEDVDVRQVWNPQQLYDRQVEAMKKDGTDFANLGSREHWVLGQYAEWAGALEKAKEHYTQCAADTEYLKRDLAEQRLKRIEALLQDQAALNTLKQGRIKLGMSLFRRVRAIIDGFAAEHPEASEPVLQKLESLRANFEQRRTKHFQTLARREFVDIVEDLIEDKVREKDIAITDITSWLRKLPEDAFAELAAEKYMGKFDDVTPEQARTFWDNRWEGKTSRSWSKVSYGGGTFIIEKPKVKPPKRRRSGGRKSGGGGGGSVPIPKPPTRDQWWTRAKPQARANWALAYFVDNSELFELSDEPDRKQCSMCMGRGLLEKSLQTGDLLSYLCTRCAGAQTDKIVKYR